MNAMTRISVLSEEFVKPVREVLQTGEPLVIWHTFAWRAGQQDWYLIRSLEGLNQVVSEGVVASRFIVQRWRPEPWPSVANAEWLALGSEPLKDIPHDLLILEGSTVDVPLSRLTWIGLVEDLEEWYAEHTNCQVAVMCMSYSNPEPEIAMGYFPDADGIPRSGAY